MNESRIGVGVAGLGMMGQMHLGCYARNLKAKVVAVCDRNTDKLSGQTKVAGNIANEGVVNLEGVFTTSDFSDLLGNPDIGLLDLCLPTRQHARAIIAALEAGKHVLCEKPMAWTVEECDQIIQAQERSGHFVMIGHCLRFWPQYVRAHELLRSGALGQPLYARFHRSSGAPTWSRWLMDGSQSGGVTLDMHVHDIDAALWWFGSPDEIRASGVIDDGLPLKVDATWTYRNGPLVQIHGGWDRRPLRFRMAFEVMGERGTLSFDSSRGESLSLFRDRQEERIEFDGTTGYAPELDYFLECIQNNVAPTRTTLQSSRESVRLAREELRQIGFETLG